MRILLKLQPLQNTPLSVPREYIRNFIYSTIKDTEYGWMHDARYKHFCFSNFFPFTKDNTLHKGNIYKLLLSSPFEKLVKNVYQKAALDGEFRFGKLRFNLVSFHYIQTPLRVEHIITATPIIIRLPKHLFEKYFIDSPKEYEFWTDEMFLNAFMEPLIKNGVRRFNHYLQSIRSEENEMDESSLPLDLIKTIKYKKCVLGWDKHFRGTLWEFIINEKWQRSEFIKYLFEAGFGERNASSGSGFVNFPSIKRKSTEI